MGIGFREILVILIVVLIVFGAGKLPRVMGDLGRGIRSFKDGLRGEDEGGEDERPAKPKLPPSDSGAK